LCDGYSLTTRTLQTAHLPILPLTAILYVAAKEQPDVTLRQLNSLALVCNWSIQTVAKPTEALDTALVSLSLATSVLKPEVCSLHSR